MTTTHTLSMSLLLVLFGLTVACEPSTTAAENGETTTTVATNDPAPVVDSPAERDKSGKPVPKPATDDKAPPVEMVDEKVDSARYPNLPLGLLTNKERATLVRVTKAQLCPCPGSAESMDSCLKKEAKQCDLAVQAAMEGMRRIDDGESERDVLDAIGQFIEAAYKKYTFDLEGVPHMGDPKAPIVVVEFADFECPFCNQARVIFKELRRALGDKVVVYFKHFPLSAHEHAQLAAVASLAAHKQGKFWQMYDLLFDNQSSLNQAKIFELARDLGLNMDKFKKDVASRELIERVEADRKEALNSNVNSTPTFFINGRKYLGDKVPDAVVAAAEAELKNR